MDLDTLLIRYFGTAELGSIGEPMLASGLERIRVDLGMERDPGRRFALWALMHMLGIAPDLDVAFEDAADRDAARTLMDLAARVEPGG